MRSWLSAILPLGLWLNAAILDQPSLLAHEHDELFGLVRSKDLPILNATQQISSETMKSLIKEMEIDLSRVAEKVSLDAAIHSALSRNPNLVEQYRLFQGLLWDSIATRREWLPSLNLDAPLGFGSKSVELYSLPRASSWSRELSLKNGTNFKPELKLAWSILNLSRVSRLESQKSTIAAQGLNLRQAARELILDVQEDYYSLQRARQEEDVYQGIYNFCQRKIGSFGPSPKHSNQDSQVLAALRARALQALALRVAAQQNVVRLSASLAKRMALPTGSFVLPDKHLEIYGHWQSKLNQSVQTALANREEIKIADLRADALNSQAEATLRRYIPELTAEGVMKIENENYQLSRSNSADLLSAKGLSVDNSVSLRMKWILFDSGVLAAQASGLRKKASAINKQAELDHLQISAEVKSAYASYSSQLIQLPVLKSELQQALTSLDLRAVQANALNADLITNLIQSLDQYQSAATRWFAAQQEYNSSIARLYRATSEWPVEIAPQLTDILGYLEGIDFQVAN